MNTKAVAGIVYTDPVVTVLQQSPLLIAEYAGRTAYDSFSNSEHECIVNEDTSNLDANHSDLLDSLAWVYHHHSVLEHLSLSYLIKGTSRGVLQEIVRHRIASYTVRSTRYTMSSIINAFIAAKIFNDNSWFYNKCIDLDLLVITEPAYQLIEFESIWNKINYQYELLGKEEFINISLSKDAKTNSSLDHNSSNEVFNALQLSKNKRNVGDAFKHIVTDNFKVDLVVTFNLRSLKNYFQLRNSGSAYFQIQMLAQEMIKATPQKYLDLIIKQKH